MKTYALGLRALAFIVGMVLLTFTGWASADPPSRVARLGYLSGTVSFSPAGENDWVQAAINRPLTTGDRLWADAGGRAEIQLGGAMIGMNARTAVSVLNLDDRITQLQLTQGGLNVRVRRLQPGQTFEVATPNLALSLRQAGAYRVEVDPENDATTITVRSGQAEVFGDGFAHILDARRSYRFTGTDLRQERMGTPRLDEFDDWANERDRLYDNSGSARYVSQDVVGYQDLDAHGNWHVDATYGNVWFPARVSLGWVPYRDGHWSWIHPWGWTWVDDAPWGFAVSHYGRWASFGGQWGWVPGPSRANAYYAPALVVFIGGSNFQLTISSGAINAVGWFPLGPREVYRPAYPVSRSYFQNINVSNTVVNNTVVNNYYNNTNVTNIVYANQGVQGAVVAVPTTSFVQSQPVSRAVLSASRAQLVNAPLAIAPPLVPTDLSVRGGAAQRDRPPGRVFERPVVARSAPPAAPVGLAAQQPQLAAQPGRPLDDSARKEIKPSAPAPVIKVLPPTQAVRLPTPAPAAEPMAAPSVRPDNARGRSNERGANGAPDRAGAATPPDPTATGQQGRSPAQVQPAPPPMPTQRARPEPAPVAPSRSEPDAAVPAPRPTTAQSEAQQRAREREAAARERQRGKDEGDEGKRGRKE